MPKRWKIGLDVGGTFTDVIAVDPGDGTVKMAKVLSQSKDPVSGLEAACGALGIDPSDVADLMLGTTLATNAIVQGRLAPIALAMTRGFVDTLDIGRQNRRELYRLDAPPKLPPLVPRERRLEVAERLDAAGNVVAALDDAEIRRLVEQIEAMGVEAVAISLLHSYANGSHETRLAERLKDSVRFVAQSHELSPEPREYERTNSTALNAALMPLVTRYLERLESWAGDATGLHLFHSAGGMAAADTVRAQPLALALSGPAAGVAAAAKVAAELQLSAVIAFDMGGTTTDVSIVVDGNAQVGSNHRLAGYPIRQVMVAVESIGAGGGSIARLDGTAIRVGPDSAGADPGPACYGLGGTEPTVTDANILLGYLDPDQLLGGTVHLDVQKAETALAPIARAFNMSIHDAALGVRKVANANMARALRRVTVEHGVDARSCALLAFGGAGPMHAVALAREFGIKRVIVPRLSSAFSALGCLTAELGYAEQRVVHLPSTGWDAARLDNVVRAMTERLSARLTRAGHAPAALDVQIIGLIRYSGQSDTVEIPMAEPFATADLAARFTAAHQRLFGFYTDEPWELDTVRVRVSAPPALPLSSLRDPDKGDSVEAKRNAECWFEDIGSTMVPFFDRGALPTEWRMRGPAVIEDAWSTVVLEPASVAWLDARGHLQIELEERAA